MRLSLATAAACLLLASGTSSASYSPLSFADRVFRADVIVVGRIEALRDADYDLHVEEWLAGTGKAESLRVLRFEDWTCASRTPPYEVGQRMVSFLGRGERGLSALGAACEGDVVLDGGVAHLRFGPRACVDDEHPLTERRLRDALRALLTGYRDVGAPGYVEAWRGLLGHPEPLVAATALDRLDAEADVNPGPASAFADALADVVARPERGLRIDAARRLPEWLDRPQRAEAAARLGRQAMSGRADLRPAGALGWIAADPADAARHAAALELLADESVPLAERAAVADVLGGLISPVTSRIDPAPIARVARDALASVRDPALLLHLCGYLGRLHGRSEYPEPTDAEAERAKWLAILASEASAPSAAANPTAAPKDDPYLPPVECAVFVPHDAEDRPFLARVVRAARRARNADRAGDSSAALDAYRDVCSAALAVTDRQRALLRDLGADLDELQRRARELARDDG